LARTINFIKGKIDEEELEEGMTWKELFQRLREKVEVKAKVEDHETTWIDLLLLLFNKRSFYSLRKNSGGEMLVVKEESSKKVLDDFFEKAWKNSTLRS
jgi:hypothetical protein